MDMCTLSIWAKKGASRSARPRQQYRALLIAALISFIIKVGLGVWRCADCRVNGGRMISMAAVWIQGGWSRQDSSSVSDPLSMIYHFVFLFWKHMSPGSLWFHTMTQIARESTGCLSSSDGGKNFHGMYCMICWECMCLLSYWHKTSLCMGPDENSVCRVVNGVESKKKYIYRHYPEVSHVSFCETSYYIHTPLHRTGKCTYLHIHLYVVQVILRIEV